MYIMIRAVSEILFPEGGNCCANAQVNCTVQNKSSPILLRAVLSRKGEEWLGRIFYPQSPLNTTLNFNKGDS